MGYLSAPSTCLRLTATSHTSFPTFAEFYAKSLTNFIDDGHVGSMKMAVKEVQPREIPSRCRPRLHVNASTYWRSLREIVIAQ